MAQIITVFILLSLKGFVCITTTGLLYPGPEPSGAVSEARHTSPLLITNPPYLTQLAAFYKAFYQLKSYYHYILR